MTIATFDWIDAKLGSIGKPSPLFDVKLLNENDEEVDIGQEGEICIDVSHGISPGLFKEYYKILKNRLHNGMTDTTIAEIPHGRTKTDISIS